MKGPILYTLRGYSLNSSLRARHSVHTRPYTPVGGIVMDFYTRKLVNKHSSLFSLAFKGLVTQVALYQLKPNMEGVWNDLRTS